MPDPANIGRDRKNRTCWLLAPALPSPFSPDFVHPATAGTIIPSTSTGPITLSRIVEFSRLLHLVRLLAVSQSNSRRSLSQAGYRSKPWWAVTSPTNVIGRSVVPWRRTFIRAPGSRAAQISPIVPSFPGLLASTGWIHYVLRSRVPGYCYPLTCMA